MKKKPWPVFRTDEEAEDFVATADLTEYDFSGFVPAGHRFETQTPGVPVLLPRPLLDAVMDAADHDGVSYQDFIRRTLEKALAVRTKPAEATADVVR